MKIGIFDSGLGGLLITHSLTSALPEYDFIYLGDTARVPYGNRSQAIIYEFTRDAIEYLFRQDCALIIVACNTASAEALRKIQREYLPKRYPDRRVLGVLIPAAEAAVAATKSGHIGILATMSTINSGAFEREILKLRPDAQIAAQPAPLLVPLLENDGLKWAPPILNEYLQTLSGVDTLILGCTHYPYMKQMIRSQVGDGTTVICQDEIIPDKFRDYLKRHPEIEDKLSKNGTGQYLVTDITDQAQVMAERLYRQKISIELVDLPQVR